MSSEDDLSQPMHEQDIFHFDESQRNFDALAVSSDNGAAWYESDIMEALGYETTTSFKKVVNKAISTCASLNIDIPENFEQTKRVVDGETVSEYRLSRFACYLIAMQADGKKPEVARAQAYFAALAEAFRRYVQEAEDVERVLVRDEISEHEKTLNSTAKAAGVDNYSLFQNAGYRGLYNRNLKRLRQEKEVPSGRSPLDFMGKEELAANLFRITQTDAKLRNQGDTGQKAAEKTAEEVGKTVRKTMIDISGTTPESLPPREDIRKIKSAIKHSKVQFKKIDQSGNIE